MITRVFAAGLALMGIFGKPKGPKSPPTKPKDAPPPRKPKPTSPKTYGH